MPESNAPATVRDPQWPFDPPVFDEEVVRDHRVARAQAQAQAQEVATGLPDATGDSSAYAQEDISQEVRRLACEEALRDLDMPGTPADWMRDHSNLLRYVLRFYIRSLPSLGPKL